MNAPRRSSSSRTLSDGSKSTGRSALPRVAGVGDLRVLHAPQDAQRAPLEVAHDFPEAHGLGIDACAAGVLVRAQQVVARAQAADLGVIVAEAPRAHA